MFRKQSIARSSRPQRHARWGGIAVLSAVVMVVVIGFVALAVDVGFMAQTKSQMQGAADGAALAAGLDMPNGWGTGKTLSADQVRSSAGSAAQTVAKTYRLGEQAAAYLDTTRDLRFGQRTKTTNGAWVESWGTSPYNLVEVTIRRDQPLSGDTATRGDQKIPMFFAPVLSQSQKSASLTAKATATLSPGNGFYIPPGSGSMCPLLPIAMDEITWNNLINNGAGSDNFSYSNGTVTSGSDGIKEVSLYPDGNGNLPSGNRGTVDIGSSSNSTADLARQILHGPNEADLAYFGGKVQIPASGLLALNGDTGLSAGIKDELATIIGQPRAIPVFRSVSGPGNNATFQICKFVGIRILYVKLSGSPSQKQVIIQPAPVYSGTIVSTPGAMQPDSIMSPLKLIH